MNLRLSAVTLTLALVGAGGCRTESPPAARPAEPPHSTAAEPEGAGGPGLPLREIMRALGADMGAVAMAVWADDRAGVAAAARRIADHPSVSAEQRAAIQAALGAEFPAFARHDHAVHEAALGLAAAADSGRVGAALLAPLGQVQQGCIACHDAFRTRVAAALGDSVGGTRTP
ncbi:MAG: cytochrome c [Gemmatimonadetes bacterium]|nr:cytochrome c [Gemmatimonadota bacterium]MCC7132876.1 cytochrome c [Gemmatimonadales bacterium]